MPIQSVNDFVIRFANVNGSGSASANLLFARSILRMGVPIAPRNIFPSNIQGLPTWYEVRVSGDGHLGARGGADFVVAMNPQTFANDVKAIEPGGYLFYDSSRYVPPAQLRDDIVVLGMPLTEICTKEYRDARQRQLFKNIVYVGALAALLDIEIATVEKLIGDQFKGKEKLIQPNLRALRLGYEDAKQRFSCPIGLRVKRSDAVGDRILTDGNFAAALGAVYGGATVCAWYPITPSTSLAEAFEKNCARLRVDRETGEKRYAIVQAEDEIAAIGVVVGAGWNGARAFTATSGPGISLMQEFLGLAYFAEIPAVIFDVQRGGPSTGMPTRTQQADLLECAYASHGDTRHILLFPSNPAECFEFAVKSFDLADRFQTPVIMLSDLDIGMNDWVVPKLAWDDSYRPDRGRVLSEEDLKNVPRFHRYSDEDQYYVPPRTLPGVDPKGAYVTRGSGHNKFGGYTETPSEYQEVVDRLARKQKAAADLVPLPKIHGRPGARLGVIAIGSCDGAVREAMELLAAHEIEADYLRICGFPFHASVERFLYDHEITFIVEQNRDAQLRSLLTLETCVPKNRLRSVLVYGGFPLSAKHVVDGILNQLEADHAIHR